MRNGSVSSSIVLLKYRIADVSLIDDTQFIIEKANFMHSIKFIHNKFCEKANHHGGMIL